MIFFYLLAWGNLSLKIESIMFTKQNIIVCHIYWIIILITLWTITGSLTNTLITLHKYFCWGSYSLREIFSRLFIKSLRQIWTFNSSPSVVFSNWSMRNLSLNDGKNYVPSESSVLPLLFKIIPKQKLTEDFNWHNSAVSSLNISPEQ